MLFLTPRAQPVTRCRNGRWARHHTGPERHRRTQHRSHARRGATLFAAALRLGERALDASFRNGALTQVRADQFGKPVLFFGAACHSPIGDSLIPLRSHRQMQFIPPRLCAGRSVVGLELCGCGITGRLRSQRRASSIPYCSVYK